jgi:hypothetical protein
MPPRLLIAIALGFATMAAGFWLKWRVLLHPDPDGWYAYSSIHWAYTDLVALYLQQGLDTGRPPYLQTQLEYPVVIGALQYLLAVCTPGVRGYFVAAGLLLTLAGLASIWLIHALSPRSHLLLFAATPPLLLYAALNWDLLAIFFTLLSLLLFQRKRDGWSALFLTLGIWTKLFPALLLPWMLLQRARGREWKSLITTGMVVAVATLAMNLPFLWNNPEGWYYFLEFHRDRSPDGGSIWHQFTEWSAERVNEASFALSIVAIASLLLLGMWKRRDDTEYALGSLAILLLASKITSPQYHLWLMPFLALIPVPTWLIGLFIGVDVFYYWGSFQTLYAHWMGLDGSQFPYAPATAAINVTRQGTLLLIWLWVIRRWLLKGEIKGLWID